MGLFSSKIETYVSSSVYNLAGDEDLRPQLIPSAIVGSVMRGDGDIVKALQSAQLNGAGLKQRRFFNWATRNNIRGLPTAILDGSVDYTAEEILPGLIVALNPTAEQTIRVLSSTVDEGDIHYWAEYEALKLYPDLDEDAWSVEWDPYTPLVTIRIAGEPDITMAPPADFMWAREDSENCLLFVAYTIITEPADGGPVTESEPQLFTYRMGSGTVAFDLLAQPSEVMTQFYPALPLRLDNISILNSTYAARYAEAAKAYKKLTGSSFETLIKSFQDNPNLGDIDYCFLAQGVPLNVKDNVGREYLYRFMEKLQAIQKRNRNEVYTWMYKQGQTNAAVLEWRRWILSNIEENPNAANYPQNNLPKPSNGFPTAAFPPMSELRISSPTLRAYDMRIRWMYVHETQHVGNAKTFDGNTSRGLAKKGEFWIKNHGSIQLKRWHTINETRRNSEGEYEFRYSTWKYLDLPRTYFFHQHDTHRYSRLEVLGLEHLNYVYNGHAVVTKAGEALADGDDSGFFLPLHYPTFAELGLVKMNQMSSCSAYLVMNSYQEVKIKWYQKGFFRVILAIAGIVLSFFTGGTSLALSGGILGSNLAVGAFLGVANAATAAIVGAVANAIAGMLISIAISKLSTAIFGEKIGAILGTLITFIAMNVGANFAQTGSFNIDWGQMMRAENLVKVTNSVSDAYAKWLEVDTNTMLEEVTALESNYSSMMEEVEARTDEFLGMTNIAIDPMMFTDATEYLGESRSSFLERTLLTGSDIAELTHALIESFADISLELPGAIR